jgi:hypothetical protein
MSNANHWRQDYDRIVAELIGKGVTTIDGLCAITGLLRDEIADVADRLCRRGLIARDRERRDTFSA